MHSNITCNYLNRRPTHRRENPYALVDRTHREHAADSIGDDRGLFVDLPFLQGGYDWYNLVAVDRTRYDSNNALPISRDHIPHLGSVKRHHILARLDFLEMDPDEVHYNNIKTELELHRQLITKTVSSWIRHFVIYVANSIGMSINGSRIRTWSDYMYWVENHCRNREDALLILKSLFISWHYVPDFRFTIGICVMMTYNMTMIAADRIGISRNFLEKMITFRINLLKKQVNDACEEHNGFNFKTTRRNGKLGLDKPLPKYILPWMITKSDTLVKKSLKRSAVNNSVTKVKRRNLATYTKIEKLTEDQILIEIENIDKRKEALTRQLIDIREGGKIKSILLINIFVCHS